MAENAVHITSSLQTKPSIFEVIAQESLSELLYPSFKILTQFLGSRNPEKYSLLNEWYDEAFLGINGIIQLHYIIHKDASFSESFYGLQRGLSNLKSKRLTTDARIWSFICLVCLPYLARKVEIYVLEHQNDKVGRAAALGHRALVASWRTVCFTQYLLYLTGRVDAHSPLLSVARLSLHHCSDQPFVSYSWRDCLAKPIVGLRLLGSGLTRGLELGAFFLQCLQWWHSNEGDHHRMATATSNLPPPTLLHPEEGQDHTICPVCKSPCKIETALLTSGYVFCYRCIRNAIVYKQQCPVTGLPATLDELVRLYPTK